MEEKFLTDIVLLLREMQWLYDFPVTQVFTRNVFAYMPEEWNATFANIDLDALNGVPECNSQQCKILSLEQWIMSVHPEFAADATQDCMLPKVFFKGLSAKKSHEVTSLVCCVKQLSEITESHHILDIGSGMGYVDSILHYSLKVTVMGAESEDDRVKKAHARQVGLTGFCRGIQHINWVLQDDQATVDKAKEIIHKLVSSDMPCTCNINRQGTQNTTFMKEHQSSEQIVSSEADRLIQGSEIVNVEGSTVVNVEGSAIVNVEGSTIVNVEGSTVECNSGASKSVMVLGLHSCADLSPVMIKIFKDCHEVSSLILLSCCYHKMERTNICVSLEQNDVNGDVIQHSNNSSQTGKVEAATVDGKESPSLCNASFVESISEGKCGKDCVNGFTNFPMSKMLKGIMKENNFLLSVFGMRLAAQESGVRWSKYTEEDHKSHENNVAYRALLEGFCEKEGVTLKKRRRRCVRKSKFCDFKEYVKTVIENYEFVAAEHDVQDSLGKDSKDITEEVCIDTESKPSTSSMVKDLSSTVCSCDSVGTLSEKNRLSPEYIEDGLRQCYVKYKEMFSLIEPLTGLQFALQPVVEALVLIDRVVYLKECQFEKVWLEKVFDVSISPRNVALIAVR